MKYDEIVKALRIHASADIECYECAYYDDCRINGNGHTKMMTDAAAAIEELDAEETRLLLLTSELQDKLMDAEAEVKRLELDNEDYEYTLRERWEPHWVSVFDELPRHNAVVVVSDGKRSWDVGQYHFLFKADDRTIWWWKKHTTRKVLWWMYKEDALPQTPQEVQE